jgi:hypothetical protein
MIKVANRSPEPDGNHWQFLLRFDPNCGRVRHGGFGRWQHPTARDAFASTFGPTGAEYAPRDLVGLGNSERPYGYAPQAPGSYGFE